MTDYNDGKWHGWNGGYSGECPIHPESRIEVVFRNMRGEMMHSPDRAAGEHNWEACKPSQTFAFRVTKEHRKPRESWMDAGGCFWATKKEALRYGSATLFREVIE